MEWNVRHGQQHKAYNQHRMVAFSPPNPTSIWNRPFVPGMSYPHILDNNTMDGLKVVQDIQANSGGNHSYDALSSGVDHGPPPFGFKRRHYNYKSKSPKPHEYKANPCHEKNAMERTFGPSYLNVSAPESSAFTAKQRKFITDEYVNNQYQMAMYRPNCFDNNDIWQGHLMRNQFSRQQQTNDYRVSRTSSETFLTGKNPFDVSTRRDDREQKNWHHSEYRAHQNSMKFNRGPHEFKSGRKFTDRKEKTRPHQSVC